MLSRNRMKYMCPPSLTRSTWHDLSSARIFVHIKTRICLSSGIVVCNSFKTYGNIPTDNARSTAQGPISRNLPRSTNARNR
uniref:Regulatory-associated protein of TOR 1 isoform X1 n=1 Tax=Rhizophora mucronata TaxID=61149 RepID=A0A2P2MA82_RHIMU